MEGEELKQRRGACSSLLKALGKLAKGQINHTFSHFQLKLKVYICENVEEKKVRRNLDTKIKYF